MAIPATHRPILVNDDGWIISEAQPPLTARDLKEKMVDTYGGTPLGALLWCLGNREVYDFETRVGEMFGAGYDSLEGLTASEEYTLFDDRYQANRAANLRSLIDERGGPLTAMVELCREAGLDIFPSMRMNSHYHIDPDTPRAGRFRRENPDALIGKPDETIPQGSLDWGVRTGADYTHPEVRRHMAGVICELFERFDVDGVELDFMRHPTFFPLKYGYANRHLMTDLVRHVKRRMADVGKNRGRRLDLAVRVPPTLYDANRLGLDVAAWMAEGLVDMVIVGEGSSLSRRPSGSSWRPRKAPAAWCTAPSSGSGPPWTMSLSARSRRTTMTTAPPGYTSSTTSPSPGVEEEDVRRACGPGGACQAR